MPLHFDRDGLLRIVRESDGFKQLQHDANERVRAIAREVNATHAGQPVDEVDAELRGRFEAAGLSPTEPAFTGLVQAISLGDLTD